MNRCKIDIGSEIVDDCLDQHQVGVSYGDDYEDESYGSGERIKNLIIAKVVLNFLDLETKSFSALSLKLLENEKEYMQGICELNRRVNMSKRNKMIYVYKEPWHRKTIRKKKIQVNH